MAIDKKSAKGRLDKWYKLAKEKGYRARAAFKLIQLNRKYHVLEKAKVLIDLCAAPGSWLQVASEVMPPNSLMVGVDLAPIKPIPRCTVFQSDITSDKCRATLRQHIKTLKADVVLHDGAPNVGTAWIQDAFSQAELVLQSLKLATEFLAPGGTFITKVFRSKDYNSLLWVFNQLFNKVEATKPPSSRSVSAEIFVVCRDFKAPKRIDPRFLDSKHVFAELSAPQVDVEAKVFKPEQKRRKRDGYEEGDWTQHKEVAASEFIQTGDPISILGSINKLSFEQKPNGDVALAALDRMPETTLEVRQCCQDLKVLGRKEFKILLRWRSKVRDILGFSAKAKAQQKAAEAAEEEVAEVEDMDEEMKMQEDMQKMIDAADAKKKRAKRKDNERKQKEIVRMQMNMTTPFDVLEMDDRNEDSMFALKTAEKGGDLSSIVRGKMAVISAKPDVEARTKFREIEEDDEAADDIEGQLDSLYNQYKERKASTDAKYRAKRARTEHHDDDFEGFSDREDVSSDDEIVDGSDSDSEDDSPASKQPLLTDLSSQSHSQPGSNSLSKRASLFFDQDIFKGIDMTQDDSGVDVADDASSDSAEPVDHPKQTLQTSAATVEEEESSDEDFEIVTEQKPAESWDEGDDHDAEARQLTKDGRPRVDIITAEAMTLAHQMATGQRTRGSLVDDSFNRYSHRDVDGLPEWFLDDEDRHSRLQKPVTRDAAAAIKEKLRALNARPIKKVREAKARKKFKAAQRLEKLKKKSALLVEDGDMTEKDKAEAVRKLMGKALKRKPRQQVSVVVAKGGNRGISGRPKGTKGKYKMVDARLKKDVRGLKRAKARKK